MHYKPNELIEEIKQQRKFASDNLSDATPQTMNSRIGRKRHAAMRLDELFFEYRKLFRDRVFAIIAIGEQVEEFEKISSSIAGLISLEYDSLFNQIASKIDKRLLEKGESSGYVLEVASRYLEDTALELGVMSYNQIIYKDKYSGKISTTEEAAELIKRAINEQVGEDLAALFVVDHAIRLAFELDLESKTHPILVKVKNEKDLQSLLLGLKKLGNRSMVVSAGNSPVEAEFKTEEVSEKTVLETLKKIKKKLK